jgi:ABC-2 type transport system ATP-binding protein
VSPSPYLAVRGLARRFGEVEALRGLDFEVARGELFGVVGPDGAGKTTLLRMLAGVMRPSAGDAWIEGVSVVREPERVKRSLAYMSQRFGLYADLTVAENIAFYADLYRVPRRERPARLEQLYGFSGLGPFRDRRAGALSGGMKQKLSLSCALIHRPPLLLLDEPTFGVDPISRRDLWLIIHEMVAAGTTVIASTAYLDEAERCDRVLLLNLGRRLGLAPPEAMQARMAGRVFQVSGSGDPGQAVALLQDASGVRTASRFGNHLHVALDTPSDGAAVRAALTGAGLDGWTVAPAEPSLEDVFIDLVSGPAHE